jgi:hypothetical protein
MVFVPPEMPETSPVMGDVVLRYVMTTEAVPAGPTAADAPAAGKLTGPASKALRIVAAVAL